MNIAHLKFLFYLFCASTCLALKPTYYPFGPQVNVSDSELVGWTRCWNATYIAQNSNNDNVTQVYANCQGDYLLYGCRPSLNEPFTVLAVGNRTIVMKDVGKQPYSVNNENGANWYWSSFHSIGFAKEGDRIERDSCDWIRGDYPELKLCWHTENTPGMFSNGYLCGVNDSLLSPNTWSREIWVPTDPCQALNEGDACDDNKPCTTGTTCTNSVCSGGSPVTCEECHECEPTSGCVPKQDGASCSDNNNCTDEDTCQAGVCVGDSAVTCTVPTACFNSTCNAVSGQCENDCPAPVIGPGLDNPTSKTSSANHLATLGLFVAVTLAL